MPLSGQVGVIPGTVGKFWNGVATSCHFATIYYVHCEEFTRAPNLNNYINIGNPNLVVNKMLPFGRRVRRPTAGNVVFTPGSVYVFAIGDQAGHSCTAINNNTVGGYNQTGWFSNPGQDHGYTTHGAGHLVWLNSNHVQANGTAYQFWEIPELVARAVLRQNFLPS